MSFKELKVICGNMCISCFNEQQTTYRKCVRKCVNERLMSGLEEKHFPHTRVMLKDAIVGRLIKGLTFHQKVTSR